MRYRRSLEDAVALAFSLLNSYKLEKRPFRHFQSFLSEFLLYKGVELASNRPIIIKFTFQIQYLEHEYCCFMDLYRTSGGGNIVLLPIEFCVLSTLELAVAVYEDYGYRFVSMDEYSYFQKDIALFFEFAIKAAKCLNFMHFHGFVHGELNIWSFCTSPDRRDVRVSTIGQGKNSFQDCLYMFSWSSSGHSADTNSWLPFISPEQTGRTFDTVDYRTDIYSFGIVLFVLLTGTFPYTGNSVKLIRAVITEPLPYDDLEKYNVPPLLIKILAKMTQKRPDDRYLSFAGLIYDLQKCRDSFENNDPDLSDFQLATHDSTYIFYLPSVTFGREAVLEQAISVMHLNYAAQSAKVQNEAMSDGSFSADGVSLQEVSSLKEQLSSNPSWNVLLEDPDDFSSVSLFIIGETGIGKSNLVRQLYSRKQALMAISEFTASQYAPYSAILVAVSSIIRQLLTEDEKCVSFFCKCIKERLFSHFDALCIFFRLVPELKGVFWEELDFLKKDDAFSGFSNLDFIPSTDMSISDPFSSDSNPHDADEGPFSNVWASVHNSLRSGTSRARFLHVMTEFFRIFSKIRPVALVLENLQFADESSLEFLKRIIDLKVPVCLIMTLHSDYIYILKNLEKIQSANVLELQLNPLSYQVVAEFLKVVVHKNLDYIAPLVSYVYHKSMGVPIKIRNITTECYERGILKFSWMVNEWCIDFELLQQINKETYEEDNLQLFLRKFNRLDDMQKILLSWAAMLGDYFFFNLVRQLAHDSNIPEYRADIDKQSIFPLLRDGLIYETEKDDMYRFSHVSNIESVVSFIPKELRKLMFASMSRHCLNDSQYMDNLDVSSYIVRAIDLLKDDPNRLCYSEILSHEAQKSQLNWESTRAVYLSKKCLQFLTFNDLNAFDKNSRGRALSVFAQVSELLWFFEDFEETDLLFGQLENLPFSYDQKIPIYMFKCRMLFEQRKPVESYNYCFENIKRFDVPLTFLTDFDVDTEFKWMVSRFLSTQAIEQIQPEDLITDSSIMNVSAFLFEAITASLWLPREEQVICTRCVSDVFFEYGPTQYTGYCMIVIAIFTAKTAGSWEDMLQLANIGRTFNKKYGTRRSKARGEHLFKAFLGNVFLPRGAEDYSSKEVMNLCIASGERVFLSYSYMEMLWVQFLYSSSRSEFLTYCDDYLKEISTWDADAKHASFIAPIIRLVLCTSGYNTLKESQEAFDNLPLNTHLTTMNLPYGPNFRLYGIWWYSFYMLNLVLQENWLGTLELGNWYIKQHSVLIYHSPLLFTSMMLAVGAHGILSVSGESAKEKASRAFSSLNFLLKMKEENLNNRCLLYATVIFIKAYYFKTLDRKVDAAVYFEKILTFSEQNEVPLFAAFAHEQLCDIYSKSGRWVSCSHYIQAALNIFSELSFFPKCEILKNRYQNILKITNLRPSLDKATQSSESSHFSQSFLRTDIDSPEEPESLWYSPPIPEEGDSNEPAWQLENMLTTLDIMDLTSVLKSSQVIASELNWESLLRKITAIMMENSCCDAASIIVIDDFRFELVAHRTADHCEVFDPAFPVTETQNYLPSRLLKYAVHSRQSLFTNNVEADYNFGVEAWTKAYPMGRSLVITPVYQKKKPVALLCLQNHPNAFQTRHLSVMSILASQVSFAIVNVSLFKKFDKATAMNMEIIASQKQALELVQASKANYKNFINSMPCLLAKGVVQENIIVKPLGLFWYEYCPNFDDTRPDFMKVLIHPEDLPKVKKLILQIHKDCQSPPIIEVRFLTKSKKYRWNLMSANPLHDCEVNNEILLAAVDIHDQKQARASAFKVMQLRANFLANISHELRTPFSGFYGMLSLLAETNLDDEQRDIVATAKDSCEMLLQIINDLLNFTKLEAGKSLLSIFIIAVMAKKIFFAIFIDPQLPSFVAGDSTKIAQVLKTIIENSVSATVEGYVHVYCDLTKTLHHKNQEDTAVVRFTISDTRPLEKAYERERLIEGLLNPSDESPKVNDSTTLGMSICLRLCKIMSKNLNVSVNEEKEFFSFSFDVSLKLLNSQRLAILSRKTSDAQTALKKFFKNMTTIRGRFFDSPTFFDRILLKDKLHELSSRNLEVFEKSLLSLKSEEHQKTDEFLKDNPAGHSTFFALQLPVTEECFCTALLNFLSKKPYETIQNIIDTHLVTSTSKPFDFDKLKDKVILVADDNVISQMTLGKQASRLGMKAEAALDGEIAVRMILEHPPGYYSLAFLDHNMPKMSGLEVARRIRKYEKQKRDAGHLPIIALTADLKDSVGDACFQVGMDDYIIKPLKNETLLEILKKYVIEARSN
ncbi:HisK/Mak3 protein kinase Mak3 [Schizosaccharomyces japonicus yFS275]|uniref:histidine kinase n=1 Tax=Schizosaccharomyces japonicus (strain yFS275 / FY16936) TaxID=402676 RepID=B6JYC7_SCHJY|nr:HisK/Mak3 protein kinase Mak3 [Schizosaccharomyces japonicus yFS275]EEB06545.2 HisK/Mak3 protein kinase Mak3 [Schizosaccharomyces japonicus yFS275]